MAVTNRILWLINVILLLTLTFSMAEGSNSWNHGIPEKGQDQESTTQSTIEDLPISSDASRNSNDRHLEFNDKDTKYNLRFQNLPDNFKTLFLSVEEIINKTDAFLASEAGKHTRLLFNRQTHEIVDEKLEPLASRIERTLVPGTWKAMTITQGCCPSVGSFYSDATFLNNVSGRRRKIVHFPNYIPQMFQYIYRATCCLDSYGANGHCIQGYVTMSLAVFDTRFDPPIAFDLFSIPSYCRCVHY
ncbi:unnamed protein product [Candidula unifasciata]|uniref:Spaetzle domain-containing protein n=1 Tax=Candidula unifasciata TaxID=100452 RepID=A0A8S3YZW8_9EUPU|nr:unnamed protein product [Candidula unifasciata]